MKARILLAADVDGSGRSNAHIVERLCTSRSSATPPRQGVTRPWVRKKQERPSRTPILDVEEQAKLMAPAATAAEPLIVSVATADQMRIVTRKLPQQSSNVSS